MTYDCWFWPQLDNKVVKLHLYFAIDLNFRLMKHLGQREGDQQCVIKRFFESGHVWIQINLLWSTNWTRHAMCKTMKVCKHREFSKQLISKELCRCCQLCCPNHRKHLYRNGDTWNLQPNQSSGNQESMSEAHQEARHMTRPWRGFWLICNNNSSGYVHVLKWVTQVLLHIIDCL